MFIEVTFDNRTKGMVNTDQITIVEVAVDGGTMITLQNDNYYLVKESYDEVKVLLRGTVKTEPKHVRVPHTAEEVMRGYIEVQFTKMRDKGYTKARALQLLRADSKVDQAILKQVVSEKSETEPIVADGITYQVPKLSDTEILQQYHYWRKQGYSHVASTSVMINTLKIDPRLLHELTLGHQD